MLERFFLFLLKSEMRILIKCVLISAFTVAFLSLLVALFAEKKGTITAFTSFTILLMIVIYVALCGYILNKPKARLKAVLVFILGTLSVVLSLIVLFGYIYSIFGISYVEYGTQPSTKIEYSLPCCFYFSAITWTTVGYGDYSPNGLGRWFAAIEALVGTAFLSIIIATITVTFQNIESRWLKQPKREHLPRIDFFR